MRLEVGKTYINRGGETVKIIGKEVQLADIYYDNKARAYFDDGFPAHKDMTENERIVSCSY